MMSLDPGVLGWTEFWLRIAFLAGVAVTLLLAGLIVLRVAVTIFDALAWIFGKLRGNRHGNA